MSIHGGPEPLLFSKTALLSLFKNNRKNKSTILDTREKILQNPQKYIRKSMSSDDMNTLLEKHYYPEQKGKISFFMMDSPNINYGDYLLMLFNNRTLKKRA